MRYLALSALTLSQLTWMRRVNIDKRIDTFDILVEITIAYKTFIAPNDDVWSKHTFHARHSIKLLDGNKHRKRNSANRQKSHGLSFQTKEVTPKCKTELFYYHVIRDWIFLCSKKEQVLYSLQYTDGTKGNDNSGSSNLFIFYYERTDSYKTRQLLRPITKRNGNGE